MDVVAYIGQLLVAMLSSSPLCCIREYLLTALTVAGEHSSSWIDLEGVQKPLVSL